MKSFKKPLLAAFVVALAMLCIYGCKKDLVMPKTKTTTNPITNQSTDNTMVAVPGAGMVPASSVHLIHRGNYLMMQNGHYLEVEKGTKRIVTDFGQFSSSTNPLKGLQQNDAHIPVKDAKGGRVPAKANWITWWQWTNTNTSSPINYFNTSWVVPTAPTARDGELLFIYNALTDSAHTRILQPVLQWGISKAGGGNYWAIATWYVDQSNQSNQFYGYTTADSVGVGTTLTGIMINTGIKAPVSYNYDCWFAGYHDTLKVIYGDTVGIKQPPNIFPQIPQLTVANETLEAYGNTGNPPANLNDYPSDDSIRMKAVALETASSYATLSSNYLITNNVYNYGQYTDVKSSANPGGEVDIHFHNIIAPNISYSSPVGYTVNTAITPLIPTNTGGVITTTYSVSPALPSGLSINTSNGVISGTPTVVSQPGSNYTVTATNSAGNSSAVVNIEIWPAPVLNVSYGGHPGYVIFTVTPNVPSPGTGVLYYKDLNTGQSNQSAGSPYGWTTTFTVGHTYQFYFVEWGANPPGPGSATSNTVQYTVN